MKSANKRLWALAALSAWIGIGQATLFSAPAHAGLGDQESAIEDDRRALNGVLRRAVARVARNGAPFTVVEINTAGRTIKEYVSRDGVIFAVTWQGINHPDLSVLLGTYYGEFRQAAQNAPVPVGRKSYFTVQSPHAVVARSGHMRAFRGKAIVPSLLPEGVSSDEIR